jgi:ABC-type uncharacterized transport system YnjBCD substrate-binding protein
LGHTYPPDANRALAGSRSLSCTPLRFLRPFDPTDPEFQQHGMGKDFYTYATLPLAAEPTNMFENFNAGDSWISVYAMDYALWSARQGTMPPTTKAGFLEEGIDAGGQAYMVVPANIPEGDKLAAYEVINFLLSDEMQSAWCPLCAVSEHLVQDKVPPIVWEQIPPPEVAWRPRSRLRK